MKNTHRCSCVLKREKRGLERENWEEERETLVKIKEKGSYTLYMPAHDPLQSPINRPCSGPLAPSPFTLFFYFLYPLFHFCTPTCIHFYSFSIMSIYHAFLFLITFYFTASYIVLVCICMFHFIVKHF